MTALTRLHQLARRHGTPLFVVDHARLRRNLAEFRKHLPRVQPYFAVKANSLPEIVRTLYRAGASFDVASIAEFRTVYENIQNLPPKKRQDFIWDKIIYANPIKDKHTLEELNQYKPLVTYDNVEEVRKIRRYAPAAGLILRLNVPNTGSVVELSSKFGAAPGDAVDLIDAAAAAGLTVEGLSFHVGSQCTNFQNFVQALALADGVMKEAWSRGHRQVRILDIGGGFPAAYDPHVRPFRDLARTLNTEFDRLFPPDMEILAEPGRFMVATACTLVAEVIGKADRNSKRCYYLNDGVYHTYSGIIFDHCKYPVKAFKKGPTQLCAVFGPTCDALDTISLAEPLPELEIGDLVYSPNIGAYSHASSTWFNGFPPAKVVHINC
ncbi:MAG: type III PLP-dependent enzyme [Kiritimatiellae bacterium]|jgi:ornithine decarboxylase|nr:type III PLP-dependent enzyme [Kiritimatiellia bacterium]NLD90178.1 type III PLP-dependent enzyme [Lentisphaerota bacterium]HQK89183.1 type III PLP-dependent enzyme [Acidobacteriota bacterium]HOU20827.1 type III PLP-dependent enzyme [Kiritimatiellia bacterium]HPC19578.1 type III PLP-dependent enzyme [Kiritimatiellia bacterium]